MAHYIIFFTAFLLRDKGIDTSKSNEEQEPLQMLEQTIIDILKDEGTNGTELTTEMTTEESAHTDFYSSDSCYLIHGRYNRVNTPRDEEVRSKQEFINESK